MTHWGGEGGAPLNARLNGKNDIALKAATWATIIPPIKDIPKTEVRRNVEKNGQRARMGQVSKRIVEIVRHYSRDTRDATGAVNNFPNRIKSQESVQRECNATIVEIFQETQPTDPKPQPEHRYPKDGPYKTSHLGKQVAANDIVELPLPRERPNQ